MLTKLFHRLNHANETLLPNHNHFSVVYWWLAIVLNMPVALNKVHKKISKKRGGKTNSLHENSRDAQRLRAAGAREEKLSRILDAAVRANRTYGECELLMAPDPYSLDHY
jgi:hypothetical protein